jgi:tetratricopeptide (TPR) repeat protein
MANVELHRSLFGAGLVGTIDSAPALSWLDSRRLEQAAEGSMASAVELRMIHGALWRLEGTLGFRLDQQTEVLERQLAALAAIDATLRTPAKTRAAERIADTAELLRRGRYERALTIAEEAIVDDPNNPAGFRAAGWALLGLGRTREAQEHFVECAAAADGDDCAQALRQAARLAYLTESPARAVRLLDAVPDSIGDLTRRGVDYDRALYLAEQGSIAEARLTLRRAFDGDLRFAFLALGDRIFQKHEEVLHDARAFVGDALGQLRSHRADAETAVRQIVALVRGDSDPAAARLHDLEEDLANLEAFEPESFAALSARLVDIRRSAEELRDELTARAEREASQAAANEARARERDRQRELSRRRLAALDAAVSEVLAVAGDGATHRRSLGFAAEVSTPGTFLRSPRAWSLSVDDQCRVSVRGPDGRISEISPT